MDLSIPDNSASAVAAGPSDLAEAIAARRTFAIISHPDAGKTTLTEKLLLYGNAIHLAGSVRARRSQRHATSDWMAMERERGISITSTVLQFPYRGRIVNLLDTPGHEDFSEDTYRTLAAVDSAVMVLDAAKGIEAQTRKLFEVTKRRGLPLFSFINKMDRPARHPLELLDGLIIDFDTELMLAGAQTPVYFGSALTNFGVRLFLDGFVEHAPPPQPYPSDAGPIVPDRPGFSGFVFKVQANMNPNHRDSVAFLRVVSGRFERDMSVAHARTGKTIRLPRPYRFFANEREVIEEAYPGDIIGLPSGGQFAIGDTLSAGATFNFAPIPRFQPEHFALLRNTDIGKQKQFQRGLAQLETEGAMQVLYEADAAQRNPILAVVGRLQFDVVQARLEAEYGVKTIVEPMTYKVARWLEGKPEDRERLPWGHGLLRARDGQDRLVALFRSPFDLNYCLEKYPAVRYEMATGV